MAIPDYQSIMQPLLELHRNGGVHSRQELEAALGRRFELTADEMEQLQPAGHQRVFANRIGWAVTYLVKAGVLERPERAMSTITPRGLDLLNEAVPVSNSVLQRFPEFTSFLLGRSQKEPRAGGRHAVRPEDQTPVASGTPNEVIQGAVEQLRRALADELLDRIRAQTPTFFEQLVVDVLLAMGYGGSREDAGQRLGRSHDGGIDGTILEDALGLSSIHVQAKRWEKPVGRPDVQAFIGALAGVRGNKGVFITTSSFTGEARSYVESLSAQVALIDGPMLASLMMNHGVGVSTKTITVAELDLDYFVDSDD